MTRELVQATPRKAMTKARRLRLYLACKGRCECGVKVPMDGTTIDHRIQLWMGGADDDSNLRFFCKACDKPKTAKDAGDRAKVKRILSREAGERKPSRLRSRGFDKSKTKRFDGSVVLRRDKQFHELASLAAEAAEAAR
jgi:5-methylcytosine-specific restriction endonuclease McrA